MSNETDIKSPTPPALASGSGSEAWSIAKPDKEGWWWAWSARWEPGAEIMRVIKLQPDPFTAAEMYAVSVVGYSSRVRDMTDNWWWLGPITPPSLPQNSELSGGGEKQKP